MTRVLEADHGLLGSLAPELILALSGKSPRPATVQNGLAGASRRFTWAQAASVTMLAVHVCPASAGGAGRESDADIVTTKDCQAFRLTRRE